jgi:hypothetical protein
MMLAAMSSRASNVTARQKRSVLAPFAIGLCFPIKQSSLRFPLRNTTGKLLNLSRVLLVSRMRFAATPSV